MSSKNNLLKAIIEEQVEIVKDLLAKGIDPNTRVEDEDEDEDGWTALLLAASKDNFQLVRLLIEHGADINAATDDGETALSLAAFKGNLELVVYLLDQGSNIRDTRNYKALHHAAGEGYNEIVRYLITKGMPVDAPDSGWTALLIAAQEGLLETVKILIEQGADIHAKAAGSDGMGLNALMLAVCEGHTDVVRFLTGCRVDLEKTSDDGWTALMCAAQKGSLDVVKVLIERGAVINRRVKNRFSHILILYLIFYSLLIKL